jgi:hypothetical protein
LEIDVEVVSVVITSPGTIIVLVLLVDCVLVVVSVIDTLPVPGTKLITDLLLLFRVLIEVIN